jgi:hypothetical protein
MLFSSNTAVACFCPALVRPTPNHIEELSLGWRSQSKSGCPAAVPCYPPSVLERKWGHVGATQGIPPGTGGWIWLVTQWVVMGIIQGLLWYFTSAGSFIKSHSRSDGAALLTGYAVVLFPRATWASFLNVCNALGLTLWACYASASTANTGPLISVRP